MSTSLRLCHEVNDADRSIRLTASDVNDVIAEVTKGREVVSQEEFIHVRAMRYGC